MCFEPNSTGSAVDMTNPVRREEDYASDEPVVSANCSSAFFTSTQNCQWK